MTCWGYVFEEPSQLGKLDVQKALKLGVPKGPLLGKLKKGEPVEVEVEVEDDVSEQTTGNSTTKTLVKRIISPSDVVSPDVPGRKIAVLQDSSDSSYATKICMNADLVVHECTFQKDMKEEAISKGHSTSEMAADFANSINAKKLALTHFSARYTESTSKESKVMKGFQKGIETARDGNLKQGGNLKNGEKKIQKKDEIYILEKSIQSSSSSSSSSSENVAGTKRQKVEVSGPDGKKIAVSTSVSSAGSEQENQNPKNRENQENFPLAAAINAVLSSDPCCSSLPSNANLNSREARLNCEIVTDPAELILGREAQEVFNGTVIVAKDFMVLEGNDFVPNPKLAVKRFAFGLSN